MTGRAETIPICNDDEIPTLITWAGGPVAIGHLINAFYDRFGGCERMLAHRRGLAITAEQRLRFAVTMSPAADDAGLPADPEFRAALVGYLEWGTRLAMENSAPGAEPAAHAPVPRWGWGVAPPYPP